MFDFKIYKSNTKRKVFKFLRESYQEFYYCKIILNNEQSIDCHKCILIARSDFFRNILLGSWIESNSAVINLPFDADLMQIFIYYLPPLSITRKKFSLNLAIKVFLDRFNDGNLLSVYSFKNKFIYAQDLRQNKKLNYAYNELTGECFKNPNQTNGLETEREPRHLAIQSNALFAYQSKILIWFFYLLFTKISLTRTFIKVVEEYAGECDFLFNIFLADSFMKILSFCIDKIDTNKYQMNMLDYLYYMNHPTFLFPGIFVPYKNFIQVDISFTKRNLLNLISRYFVNSLVIEIFARFTNIFTIFDNFEYSIKKFSTFTLMMAIPIYCMLYGLISTNTFAFANVFHTINGIKTTELPWNALSICSFREMWRNWNSGVHIFIKDYIYIPLGGNKSSQFGYIMSLTASFLFSAIYHGFTESYIYWGLMNIIVILIESFVFKYIFNNKRFFSLTESKKRMVACILLGFWQIHLFLLQLLFVFHRDIIFHLWKLVMFNNYNLMFALCFTYCLQQIRFEKYQLNY
ncbi:unnamed protein product [Brachionus calyciflorus]|uniref:BTB domain-containing protein n=1 Tax=Brachionus calyciflorus TaxID=104777 RepID=A0A814B2L0_9BILA|nr:unnamed protein product [Brachionus calyciflorus]